MQINIEKLRKKLVRTHSQIKKEQEMSNPSNMSKDIHLFMSKKHPLNHESDKENSRPTILNSVDHIFECCLKSPLTESKKNDLKLSLHKIKAANIVMSKELIIKLIDKLETKKDITEDSMKNFKKTFHQMTKKNQITMVYLNEMKTEAMKNLINERFDDVMTENDTKDKNYNEVNDTVQKLFQKEMLFENSLKLLSQDEIDINQLLFCAFEKIQSENYCPPTGQSRFIDGYFEFSDQLKMPTSRWRKDKKKVKEFKLEFEKIDEELIYQ